MVQCKRATIRGLELDLAMPTPSMTNSEPSGSPHPAVAIAMKRVTVDASETADTDITFRVGSGASLLLSSLIATLLSYACSQFTMLSQHTMQTKVWIVSSPMYRSTQASVRISYKTIVFLILVLVILEMNVTELRQHITVPLSLNPRFQLSAPSNGTSEYAQHQDRKPRPNKR